MDTMGKYAHYTEMPDSDMKDELTASTALGVLESDEEEIPVLARLTSHVPLRIKRRDTTLGVVGHARGMIAVPNSARSATAVVFAIHEVRDREQLGSLAVQLQADSQTASSPVQADLGGSATVPKFERRLANCLAAHVSLDPVDLAPMGSAAMDSRFARAVSSAVSNGRSHPL